MRATNALMLSLLFIALGCVGDSTGVPDAGKDGTASDAAPDTSTSDVTVDAPKEAGPPFPATLSGVVVWLDAQETSTLQVTSGKVTKWVDRSNFQHDAVAVTGHEPTTGTESAHGLPVVKFANADMKLAGAGTDPSLHFDDTGDFLVEMVIFNTDSGGIVLHDISTSSFGPGLNIAVISGEDKLSFGLDYSLATRAKDTVISLDGKLRLFGFQRTASGATISVRDNAAATGTTAITPTNITTGAPFHVGAFDSAIGTPQFMTGAIGELVVVKGTVSDPDRSSLETYLMTKWQLP